MDVKTSIREEDNKTQVDVTLSAEEVQKYIDDAFKQMSKSRIPGFRPGRAPRKVLEQNFGGHDAIFAEITTDMINEVAPRAVDSQDVLFIVSPEFDESGSIVEGEPYSFSLHGKVKPEVELLTYDPVTIQLPAEEATDEEVDFQVEQLRSYYYSFEDVEGRAVESGDYVTLDMACTCEGKEVQGMNSTDRLIELGADIMPKTFEDEIIGMNVDETKEFDFSVEGEAAYDYLESTTINAKVTVKAIKGKVVPEANDDFAKMIGVESVDELRTMLKDAIDKQKAEQLPGLKEQRCTEELAKRVHGAVPVAYTNFTRQDILRSFYTQLQENNMTMDQFLAQQGITAEDFQADVEQEAKEVAEQTLALDALFKELGLEISEEDIDAEFQIVEDPAATRKQWEDAGRMSEIREAIRRRKATEWLMETAIVTEETDEEDEDEE